MKNMIIKKSIVLAIITLFIISSGISAIGLQVKKQTTNEQTNAASYSEVKYLELEFAFSDPEIVAYKNYSVVRIKETNHNRFIIYSRYESNFPYFCYDA